MSTVLHSDDVWPSITKAVKASRQRCWVAVAYFANGASKRLPLPAGSCLVVDASDHAVKSGQTCPADLQRLVRRGVRVYSVPNLHAKVFVVGKTAYVGSANVSSRSERHLIECVVATTDIRAVADAKAFVHGLCLHELTPELLERLNGLYKPPRGVSVMRRGKRDPKKKRLMAKWPRLVQLKRSKYSEVEEQLSEAARPGAKKRMKHPRTYVLEEYSCAGHCPVVQGDVVLQVITEPDGHVYVDPPANVLVVKSRRRSHEEVSVVFLERPARNRKSLARLAKSVGCTQKKLRRDALVRDGQLARRLMQAWD